MKKFNVYLFVVFATLFGLIESCSAASLQDIQKQREELVNRTVKNIFTVTCAKIVNDRDIASYIDGVVIPGDEAKRQFNQVDTFVANKFINTKNDLLNGKMPDFLKEQAENDLRRILEHDKQFFQKILIEFEKMMFARLEEKAKEMCVKEGKDFWQETTDVMEMIETSLVVHSGSDFKFDVDDVRGAYNAWLVKESMKIILNDEKFKTSYREVLEDWAKGFYQRTCWFFIGVKQSPFVVADFYRSVKNWIIPSESTVLENEEESNLKLHSPVLLLQAPPVQQEDSQYGKDDDEEGV